MFNYESFINKSKMSNFLLKLNIDFSKFTLTDSDFRIKSIIHGVDHVYRVMFNVLMIGSELNDIKNTKISFCAAFLHDLSRKHDGRCQKHGGYSVDDNFDKFKDLFLSTGLNVDDLEFIAESSIQHSIIKEVDKKSKFYKSISILKDADALDRVRLGSLNPKYLRYKESHGLIKRSEDLFYNYKKYPTFEEFLYNNLD